MPQQHVNDQGRTNILAMRSRLRWDGSIVVEIATAFAMDRPDEFDEFANAYGEGATAPTAGVDQVDPTPAYPPTKRRVAVDADGRGKRRGGRGSPGPS